jgi:hypothetical protein
MKKFYRMKLALLNREIAVNEDSIRAVLPTDEADTYRAWLTSDLSVTADIAQRIANLGGVTPITQDWWDVHSTDLKSLFP